MSKFEKNKQYTNNYICDSNLYCTYEVIKRTDKTVWIIRILKNESPYGDIIRKKIHISYDGSHEYIYPNGIYSMAFTLHADKAT